MCDIFKKIKYSFDSNPFANTKDKWVTVVIVYVDGRVNEKPYVENPWGFINALKYDTKVKTAYIKDNRNDSDPFKKRINTHR